MTDNPLEQLVGRLVAWQQTEAGAPKFGVVRAVEGVAVTVQLDGSDSRQFSASAFKARDGHPAVLRLHEFGSGDQVATLAGLRGLVVERRLAGNKAVCEVAFSDGVKIMTEAGLRPAETVDPIGRFKSGQFDSWDRYRLKAEANELYYKHLYDDLICLSISRVRAQPHQISVAHRVITEYPHRFLLCDEVGLGKTIEAGLILKELRARGHAKRVLIVVPPGLQRQWQFELKTKFNETFAVLNRETIRGVASDSTGNPWLHYDSVITSASWAAHNATRRDQIVDAGWDLVIIDEAHHARNNNSVFKLVAALADPENAASRAVLLLTATPMQLHWKELYNLVDLLDPALFPSQEHFQQHVEEIRWLGQLLKGVEDWGALDADDQRALADELEYLTDRPVAEIESSLAGAEGRAAISEVIKSRHLLSNVMLRNRKSVIGGFMPRQAERWEVSLTPAEAEAYDAVAVYVREGYALSLETKNNSLGFLMVLFQRLMASSSRALAVSLQKRKDKLLGETAGRPIDNIEEIDDETTAVDLVDGLDVAPVVPAEVERLDELLEKLEALESDSKARRLLAGLEEIVELEPDAKVIIFTQFRETQNMLRDMLEAKWPCHMFHGQMKVEQKDESVQHFHGKPGPRVLISTEAGGEGRNFQFCHFMVNYDLPWNPMKVEQRIGRLDRFGQESTVTVFNLAVRDTIEQRVLDVLEYRIKMFEQVVGGLDPILGENVERQIKEVMAEAATLQAGAAQRLGEQLEIAFDKAREAEEDLTDFIMDTRSLLPDIARQHMPNDDADAAKPYDRLRDYALSLLISWNAYIGHEEEGVYHVAFHEPFTSEFDSYVRTGNERKICFNPTVAPDSESVEFYAFGHEIVDKLTERVRESPTGAAACIALEPESGINCDMWRFTFLIDIDGLKERGEVRYVFIDDHGNVVDGPSEEAMRVRRAVAADAAAQPKEKRESIASAYEPALVRARDAAMAEVGTRFSDELDAEIAAADERFETARHKQDVYFDYHKLVVREQLERLQGQIARMEESDEAAQRAILPALRGQVESKTRTLENLERQHGEMIEDLRRKAQPNGSYNLVSVLRIFCSKKESA